MSRRRFELIAIEGTVQVSLDGKVIEETFNLSSPGDLIFYLRSANLPSTEVNRILSELATAGSTQFFSA